MKARRRWQTTCSFFIISSAWLHRHFQGERAEVKTALPVPPSKLNLTRQTRSCAPCFVCLQKNKKQKNEEAISVERGGTATFSWRILRRNTSRPRQYCRRLFFSRLVCGALIAAIIQSLRAETPARETAHHPHILMKPQSNSWETKRAPIWLLKQTARNNSQVCGPQTPSDNLPSLSLFSYSGFNAVSRQDCCGGKWSLHWTIAIWFSSSQRQPSHRVFCPNGWLYDMKTVSSFSAVICFAPLLLLTIKGSDHLSLSPTVNSPLIIKQVWEVRAKKQKHKHHIEHAGTSKHPNLKDTADTLEPADQRQYKQWTFT